VIVLSVHQDKGLVVHTGLVTRSILAGPAWENTAEVIQHKAVRTPVEVLIVDTVHQKAVGHIVMAELAIDMVHQEEDSLAVLDYLLNRDFEDIESMVIDRSCLSFPFAMSSAYTHSNIPAHYIIPLPASIANHRQIQHFLNHTACAMIKRSVKPRCIWYHKSITLS